MAKSGSTVSRERPGTLEVKPKIDFSKVHKPGDVFRQLKEREEQLHRPAVPPRPPVTAAPPPPPIAPKPPIKPVTPPPPPVQEKPTVVAPRLILPPTPPVHHAPAPPERIAVVSPPVHKPAPPVVAPPSPPSMPPTPPPLVEKPAPPPAVIVTPPVQPPPAAVSLTPVAPVAKAPVAPVVSTPAHPKEPPPVAAKPASQQPIVPQRRMITPQTGPRPVYHAPPPVPGRTIQQSTSSPGRPPAGRPQGGVVRGQPIFQRPRP